MSKLCSSLFFFARESDLFCFREETDQKSTQSIIYFPEMTMANIQLWRSGSLEFLGNVLTVAILTWGDFQGAEHLCLSQAGSLLLCYKRRPTPDTLPLTLWERSCSAITALKPPHTGSSILASVLPPYHFGHIWSVISPSSLSSGK